MGAAVSVRAFTRGGDAREPALFAVGASGVWALAVLAVDRGWRHRTRSALAPTSRAA
jgi:hypothetical protein